MENKELPNWFYVLFHSIAIKHNLDDDLREHHIEGGKKMYFSMLSDIESGKNDIEEIMLQSLSNHSIGASNINDDDEMIRTLNGSQFLFVSEFHKELYISILNDVEKQLPKEKGMQKTLKTTQKAQILILKELGVFDSHQIKNLSLEQKGIFFSSLLNMNLDNAKDYIGNLFDKKGDSGNKSPYNRQSIEQANNMLALINLPPIR
jgi:hypothetical protein